MCKEAHLTCGESRDAHNEINEINPLCPLKNTKTLRVAINKHKQNTNSKESGKHLNNVKEIRKTL